MFLGFDSKTKDPYIFLFVSICPHGQIVMNLDVLQSHTNRNIIVYTPALTVCAKAYTIGLLDPLFVHENK